MKISNFFLVLSFILIVLSCQNKKQDTRRIFLEKIAQDSNYVVYQQAISENAYWIGVGKYDLVGIRALYDKYPGVENACGFNNFDLEQVKGGVLYQEIHCKISHLAEHLNTKFQFYKLSLEDLQEIEALYGRIRGCSTIAEKIYGEPQGPSNGRCMLEAEVAYAKRLDIAEGIF